MTEQQPQPTLETLARRAGFPDVTRYDAWLSWQYATGTIDRDGFEQAYLGCYATRGALGEQMLREEYGAEERLVTLPRWLREYVRLDGEAFVADYEADGLLLIAPRTQASGVFAYRPDHRIDGVTEGVAQKQPERA